jgi:POT family proton-dependent oligopeptide transporter
VASKTPGELLGHPKGLFVLFSTELWERFSFYSMRGIMTLYMVNIVLVTMAAEKGVEAAGGFADQVYGAYLGFVYSATFVGGMLADRLLGQRRAIYIGGFLMAIAQFMLTTHALLVGSVYRPGELNVLFFMGLGLLACGNGFFKPNISTIVGTLYEQSDARRDGAFTIFYMGINIGATASSFASGAGQKWGWYLGYLFAGIGMLASLVIFFRWRAHIAGRGLPPPGATLVGRGRLRVPNVVPLTLGVLVFIPLAAYLISQPAWTQNLAKIIAIPVLVYLLFEVFRASREEAGRMIVIIVLCILSMVFWGFFELQGSTIIRFADLHVNMKVLYWELPTAFVGNVVNPALIILLGIPFSWLWVWLDRKRLEPSTPLKFSLGLLQLGLGFLLLWVAAAQAGPTGKGSLVWLVLAYLVITTGELCLSPVGLSMVTKLAPARLVGVFMGMWFLCSALANVFTGGVVGPLTEKYGFASVFLGIAGLIGASAVLLFLLTPLLKKLMHGVK